MAVEVIIGAGLISLGILVLWGLGLGVSRLLPRPSARLRYPPAHILAGLLAVIVISVLSLMSWGLGHHIMGYFQ